MAMWVEALAALALGAAVAALPASSGVPTVADPIRGLELWRGAKVGMDVAQVARLFPAAAPPARPTMLTGGEMDGLQLGGVELGGSERGGGTAIAHFFFKDAQLVAVELTLPDLKPAHSNANVALARRIATGFTARYGAAYDCGDRSLGDVTAYECKWLKAPLSIRLWYMDTAGQAPLFYLAYRQSDDPGFDL